MRRIIALCVAAVGCAGSNDAQLQFVVSSSASGQAAGSQITMRGGEKLVLGLTVVGSAPGPVTFEGHDLPAFATLSGALLTLAPQRADMGSYLLKLVAHAGSASQTSAIQLVVDRYNSAPQWNPSGLYAPYGFHDDTGGRWACPGAMCTVGPNPVLHWINACDPEGDQMIAEVEVVPRGQPFTGKATFKGSVRAPKSSTTSCYVYSIEVPMPGLVPEQAYDFAIRVSDEFGAVASVPDSDTGWAHRSDWYFDQGPCTTRKCGCMSGQITTLFQCGSDLDCCGSCPPASSVYAARYCQP
jgi:hypothetical protein